MSRKHRPRPKRRSSIESLELRQLMAVDPFNGLMDAGFSQHGTLDESPAVTADTEFPPIEAHSSFPEISQHADVEPTLDSAHNLTGLDTVRENFGFSGTGQTVVVIDSGVAYDHYALGGGYGTGYRVVGGWDFAEGDSDPYDDAPDGFHGTHVAGIIGSTGDQLGKNQGVAPGVDLVALRVFDDSGYGHFGYVSSALQWVIDHHDDFANPITAVNLSLGTAFNGDSPPTGYSYIESKFDQLEQLGIFISVSAGNSFTTNQSLVDAGTHYNTPGLSYPAASDYVVPVMSVDDGGALSYFSQRHSSAIAAPGRFIRSTLPDFAGNNNGVDDDWGSASGTSMASPYVAGASVIIREAMELLGYSTITQDVIYAHMRETADTFYDSATSQSYLRLNMESAINALMPEDDYGASDSAHGLGTLGTGTTQVSGMISSLTDGDYFTFTAGATGVATFSATESHELDVAWDFGGNVATQSGESWTMNVVAGQTYTVGLSTSGGLGYYDMDVSIESSFTFVDWGNIGGQQSHNGMNIAGEAWYRVVAGQSGYVTAQAAFANTSGNVDLALYDSNMQMLDQSTTTGNGERVDHLATAGEEFYLCITGTNSDVDVRLTNLVNKIGGQVVASGTSANDTYSFTAGSVHSLSVNGVSYSFDGATVTNFSMNGGAGSDAITFTGSSGNDMATVRVNWTNLSGSGYSATAGSMESVAIYASGGDDTAKLYDTDGDETLVAYTDHVTLTGTGFQHEVYGFDRTYTYASGGNDTATLYDSALHDNFAAWADRAVMLGTGFFNDVHNFDSVVAIASTGVDRATFYDSAGDDTYTAYSDRTVMVGTGFSNEGQNFDASHAYSTAGNDEAYFYDSAGNDLYYGYSDKALMRGTGYYNSADNFQFTAAYASSGIDKAYFLDSAGDDTYYGWADHATYSGSGFRNEAYDFGYTFASSSGGNDQAIMYGTSGDDVFTCWDERQVLTGTDYFHDVRSFGYTLAYGEGGYDRAYMHGTDNDETYNGWSDQITMQGASFLYDGRGFEYTAAFAYGGNDTATFYDTSGDDTYASWDWRAVMLGSGYFNDARDFETTYAHASDGNDRAIFHDSAADDDVHAAAWGAYCTNGLYYNEARGFDRVEAWRDLTGNDEASSDSIDYVFKLYGDWISV
ncbi:S8 family serine peptidase [Aeoliella sp. ICT_H6.2]|uniref:S8 family serine peptidase n=1 Tax=Aeoliella straminimaris TaxID=2954799 RepID=A0A9X2FIQ2_9BACT|nr:S8 family serine peptidase [Aeoliella straminimaris]MCO6047421.1 S8 family serine peptidase [Aeoliella straminimaris]